MTRLGRHVPLVVGMWVLGALPALAHEDTFAWTYPYMTPDRGERELELRTVMGSASGYQKNELELEWGVTDRF